MSYRQMSTNTKCHTLHGNPGDRKGEGVPRVNNAISKRNASHWQAYLLDPVQHVAYTFTHLPVPPGCCAIQQVMCSARTTLARLMLDAIPAIRQLLLKLN